MNRIIRCPSCTTIYQIGDEQLQVARGWLRCGPCGHVFDSTGLVLSWTPRPAPEPWPNTSPEVQEEAPDSSERIALDALLQKEDLGASEPPRPAQVDLAAFEEALSSFKPDPSPMSGLTLPASVTPPTRATSLWLTRFGVLVCGGLLLLQCAFVQRNALVAYWPATEGVIRHACQSFGCQIQPLRDVDGLVIESSSLVQHESGHVLSWTLRNSTRHGLGMTALELSLMDEGGQLVLRRVVLPEQAGAPDVLASGATWSGELGLTFTDPALVFRDYRLLSFYP